MHHHSHHHDHGHQHAHAAPSFNRAFALASGLNFAFVVIEAFYAISAHSMSLLADAGHNLGDVLGLLFAWGATWLVTKGSTEKFSYGYRRTTILAAIINALILVGTSAIIAYESLHKIFYPVQVNEFYIIVVAIIGIFINGGTALLFMRGRKDDLNIKAAFMHLAYDALISLGVVITGIIIFYTQWYRLDPVIGLIIIIIILAGTWGLLRDSVNLILDAVPHNVDKNAVEKYLMQIAGVTAVHDLHIWGLSTNEVALTCHLIIPDRHFTDADYKKLYHDLKHDFQIDHITVQVEKGNEEYLCEQVCM